MYCTMASFLSAAPTAASTLATNGGAGFRHPAAEVPFLWLHVEGDGALRQGGRPPRRPGGPPGGGSIDVVHAAIEVPAVPVLHDRDADPDDARTRRRRLGEQPGCMV